MRRFRVSAGASGIGSVFRAAYHSQRRPADYRGRPGRGIAFENRCSTPLPQHGVAAGKGGQRPQYRFGDRGRSIHRDSGGVHGGDCQSDKARRSGTGHPQATCRLRMKPGFEGLAANGIVTSAMRFAPQDHHRRACRRPASRHSSCRSGQARVGGCSSIRPRRRAGAERRAARRMGISPRKFRASDSALDPTQVFQLAA